MLHITHPLTPAEIILGKCPRSYINYRTLSNEDKIEFYRYAEKGQIPVLQAHGFDQEDILKYDIKINGHRIVYEDFFGASCLETYDKKLLTNVQKIALINQIKKHLCSDFLANGIPSVLIEQGMLEYKTKTDENYKIGYIDFWNAYETYEKTHKQQALIVSAYHINSDRIRRITLANDDRIEEMHRTISFAYNKILENKLETIELVDLFKPGNLRATWHVLYNRVSWTSPVERFKL